MSTRGPEVPHQKGSTFSKRSKVAQIVQRRKYAIEEIHRELKLSLAQDENLPELLMSAPWALGVLGDIKLLVFDNEISRRHLQGSLGDSKWPKHQSFTSATMELLDQVRGAFDCADKNVHAIEQQNGRLFGPTGYVQDILRYLQDRKLSQNRFVSSIENFQDEMEQCAKYAKEVEDRMLEAVNYANELERTLTADIRCKKHALELESQRARIELDVKHKVLNDLESRVKDSDQDFREARKLLYKIANKGELSAYITGFLLDTTSAIRRTVFSAGNMFQRTSASSVLVGTRNEYGHLKTTSFSAENLKERIDKLRGSSEEDLAWTKSQKKPGLSTGDCGFNEVLRRRHQRLLIMQSATKNAQDTLNKAKDMWLATKMQVIELSQSIEELECQSRMLEKTDKILCQAAGFIKTLQVRLSSLTGFFSVLAHVIHIVEGKHSRRFYGNIADIIQNSSDVDDDEEVGPQRQEHRQASWLTCNEHQKQVIRETLILIRGYSDFIARSADLYLKISREHILPYMRELRHGQQQHELASARRIAEMARDGYSEFYASLEAQAEEAEWQLDAIPALMFGDGERSPSGSRPVLEEVRSRGSVVRDWLSGIELDEQLRKPFFCPGHKDECGVDLDISNLPV